MGVATPRRDHHAHLVDAFPVGIAAWWREETLAKILGLTEAEERAKAVATAAFADCRSRCISDAARHLVSAVLAALREYEVVTGRKYVRHSDRVTAFAKAVEGFIGDLMLARDNAAAQGWIFRPLNARTFIESGISASHLSTAISGLEFFGLIERAPYARRFGTDLIVRGTTYSKGGGTCFRGTFKLAAMARDSGVDMGSQRANFRKGLPMFFGPGGGNGPAPAVDVKSSTRPD
jgi:hypothetical protein